MRPYQTHQKRPASARQLQLSSPLKAPWAVVTAPPGPVQDSRKQQAGRGSVLPQPDTDFVFLQEGTSSVMQMPGTAAASTEVPVQVRLSSCSFQPHPALAVELRPSLLPSSLMQAAQCSAPSWVVALPQVKQETADAPEEWTAVTTFLTSSTLQSGFPSKVWAVMGVLLVPHRWSVNKRIVSHDSGTLIE